MPNDVASARYLIMGGVIAVSACTPARRVGSDSAPSPVVPASAPTPAPALAPTDSTPTQAPVVEGPTADSLTIRWRRGSQLTVATFKPYVPVPSDSGECVPRERAPSGEGFVVTVLYPSRAAPVAAAIVLLASNDRLIRFTDRRGGLRIPSAPGLTRAQVDSAVVAFRRSVPRTTITLEYFTNRATVVNEGANRPGSGFRVPLDMIAHHKQYGAPDDRARAIVARCR